MADAPTVEPKVTAATGGAITAPALGALVVWIISEFTDVDMPFNIGEVLGGLILAGAGALAAGWAARSSTSATSQGFDLVVARQAQADVTREKIIRPNDVGHVDITTVIVMVAVAIIVFLLMRAILPV